MNPPQVPRLNLEALNNGQSDNGQSSRTARGPAGQRLKSPLATRQTDYTTGRDRSTGRSADDANVPQEKSVRPNSDIGKIEELMFEREARILKRVDRLAANVSIQNGRMKTMQETINSLNATIISESARTRCRLPYQTNPTRIECNGFVSRNDYDLVVHMFTAACVICFLWLIMFLLLFRAWCKAKERNLMLSEDTRVEQESTECPCTPLDDFQEIPDTVVTLKSLDV